MEYRYGIVVGLLVGLLVAFFLVKGLFKKQVLDMTFDERQERARGKAFQYGFIALVITVFAYGVSEMAFGRWCEALAGCAVCVAVGMVVFAATCILKDAYLSLKERPRQIVVLFAVLAAVNLGLGALYQAHGELVADGLLTFRAANPILGLALLAILVVYLIHGLGRKDGEGEEE